ncbi:MAG: hypothetical protein OXU81_13270 [Gammaproteobacteria bacterium]|nr:hypothetical protein [Gammaproteobacteria bacterium]
MSLQPAKSTTRAKREARSRLRDLPLAVVAIATLALSLTGHHSAQAQPCGPEPILRKLFNYSQLAERCPRGVTCERTTCQYGSNGQTVSPDTLEEIDLVGDGRAELIASLRNKLMAFEDSGFLEETDGALYVGCQNLFDTVKIAVELRLHSRTNKGDLIRPTVVGRQPGDNDQGWKPLVLEDEVLTLPGTDWSWDTNTALTNLFGERCAFPSARFAVLEMCAQANPGPDEPSTPSILTPGTRPTLIGHSLGATTVQFIMSAPGDGLPQCPRIDAFAFSSIGLNAANVASPTPIAGTLKSYASDCDWMAQLPGFHNEVQPGHLFVLSGSQSHLLNSVQDDLCKCLRRDGQHYLADMGRPDPTPENITLCPEPPSNTHARNGSGETNCRRS